MNSTGRRVALVAAAIAIAAVAFLVARPDDEGGRSSGPAQAGPEENRGGGPGEEIGEGRGPGGEPAPHAMRIRVRDGEPVGGLERIEVTRGEVVRLDVTADAPDEVHVHVYDLFEDVGPGDPARLRFKARLEGAFEIELEGTHTGIAKLVVSP